MEYKKAALSLRDTQKALCCIKERFSHDLAEALHLFQVAAPLFVRTGTGVNDDLNGTEKPVSFVMKHDGGTAEIVHSLAKWKRMALARYGCKRGEGIYADMRAIRADEECDDIHSLYVDQWDWEQVIEAEDRTLDYLHDCVKRIYHAMRATEHYICTVYPELEPCLSREISFVHSQDLADRYPTLSPKEREHEICKEKGAVFLIGIGADLADGIPHDGRAPDYDDWSTHTSSAHYGLNGDILVWDDVRKKALELSSMGVRVDKQALLRQLELRGVSQKSSLPFHTMLLNDELPLSIGGGIGQSRFCMFLLHKAHIKEVQESVWSDVNSGVYSLTI